MGFFDYKVGLSGDGFSYIVFQLQMGPWRVVEKGDFKSQEEAQAWADEKNAERELRERRRV